jgi:hypothetical protein
MSGVLNIDPQNYFFTSKQEGKGAVLTMNPIPLKYRRP